MTYQNPPTDHRCLVTKAMVSTALAKVLESEDLNAYIRSMVQIELTEMTSTELDLVIPTGLTWEVNHG